MLAPVAIALRAAEALRLAGIRIDPGQPGPVPLQQVFAEHCLMHAALPGLTRAAIKLHLQDNGIATGDLGPATEPLSGFLFTAGNGGWAYVDATDILPRRRFTAAHELGHFLLHQSLMPTGYLSDTSASILEAIDDEQLFSMEREANLFATELLMPAAVCQARAKQLRHEHGSCPRAVLAYRLSAELLVSREAMRYRLQALELGDG